MTSFGFSDDREMSDPAEEVVDASSLGSEYTPQQLALRNLFVSEYILDYDQVRAAQRCGFNQQLAIEWGNKFMGEPYVQLRIQRLGVGKNDDTEEIVAYDKKRIREALMREAHKTGPGSSHAARVAALKALAEMHGMIQRGPAAAQKKDESAKGGVMQVPGIASVDEWEAQASASQDALTEHAGDGE